MNAMRVISFEKLCAIHNQIYRQGTGTPEEFAEKVGLSKSQLGKYLNYFRYDLKVDISYDKYRQTYYYDGEDLFSVLETTLFHKK
jgi:response regulator of citrate/malate metabolism